MTSLREISEQYGVAKSTVRRWIESAGLGDEVLGTGKPVELNPDQMQVLAHYVLDRKLITAESASQGVVIEELRDYYEAERMEAIKRIHELELEVVKLREQLKAERDKAVEADRSSELVKESIDSLVSELKNRAEAAEAALEREQNISRGFWSRLGQKLLGDGKREK